MAAETLTQPADTDIQFFPVRVAEKKAVADGIYLYVLRHPAGAELPPFSAGAHLTVAVPNGCRRSYSLCNDPAERDAYCLAVKRDAAGRGGSVCMADEVQAGDLLQVGAPSNNFELSARARSYIFIAGGIGITPILSMMRHLKAQGTMAFKLYYLSRDAASTAFSQELREEFPGQVRIHHDQGDPSKGLDLWPVLGSPPSGAHVYCCGPAGLMDAVRDMTGHWPSGTVRFESFGAVNSATAENSAFTVRLTSGEQVEVGADESILEALRRCGIRVSSSCESGTCGSCRMELLEGEAEHRDLVLTEAEHAGSIMVCVSRAKTPQLLLKP